MARRLVLSMAVLAGTALVATACASVRPGEAVGPADTTAAAATTSPSASATPSGAPGDTAGRAGPGVLPTESATRGVPDDDPLGLGDKAIRYGQHGPHVKALQRRLKALHYDPGSVDGRYGPNTQYAVWAFRKVNGLKPTATVGHRARAALADAREPEALKPNGPAERVEIHLDDQYLVVYRHGVVALISHISTGSGQHYCQHYTDDDTGESGTACGVAVTPTGDFETYRRITGWRHSRLGYLYNPVYFNGGIAVHGEPAVPPYPASHGCVRIPMHTSTLFPDLVGQHEEVYVRR